MAESVDALVSNTNGRKFVPVRSRLWVQSVEYPLCESGDYRADIFFLGRVADVFFSCSGRFFLQKMLEVGKRG